MNFKVTIYSPFSKKLSNAERGIMHLLENYINKLWYFFSFQVFSL